MVFPSGRTTAPQCTAWGDQACLTSLLSIGFGDFGGFQSMLVPPIAGWFIVENIIKIGDDSGYLYFRKPPEEMGLKWEFNWKKTKN